jgi:hypothetical protein
MKRLFFALMLSLGIPALTGPLKFGNEHFGSLRLNSTLTTTSGGLGEGTGNASARTIAAPGGSAARAFSSRFGDQINPRNYCAVCGDGITHPASTVLGVSTLAGLATYSANGQTPFAFVASYPFGVLFNLIPEQPASSGDTTLNFQTTATIGIQVPLTAAAAAGDTTLQTPDLAVTSDQTTIIAGTALSATGLAVGTTVANPSYSFWHISLSTPTTGILASGSFVKGYVTVAAGQNTIPIIWTNGVNVGDVVTDSGGCVASGSQVDFVNVAKGEIRLSLPTAQACPAKDVLTFTPSWLSKVTAGMTVQGPTGAVVAGTTVSSVNLSTGVVTLSQPLTGAIAPSSEMLGNASPTTGQQVTFYRPFTNAEAAALEMDGLAIQAALNKANAQTNGGAVDLPTGSIWRLSTPIIFPVFSTGLDTPRNVLGGSGGNAYLEPVSDFGPDSAAISCGDPSAKASSGRGLYTGNGLFCFGAVHDIAVQPVASVAFAFGLRPKWAGAPVAMDGIKQGPRLRWDKVTVQYFRYGAQATMDHTRLQNSYLMQNFGGFRMDDTQANLFGDDILERNFLANNAECGLCIAPKGWFGGIISKPYFGTNPYAILCEPGVGAGMCLQGVTMTNANAENIGCAFIADGGIQDGWVAKGGARSILDLHEINNFHAGSYLTSWANPIPAGGCQWHAYYDIYSASGVVIDHVWPNDYPLQPNAYAHILRVNRLDGWSDFGKGGWDMRGDGILIAIQNAASWGQSFITSPNMSQGDLFYTGGWRYVTLEGPGFVARPIPFADAGATSLPVGTLVEWGSAAYGIAAVQRAGATAGVPFAGVSIQSWAANPAASFRVPVFAFAGSNVPFLTTGAATVGEMVIPATGTPGSAVSTSTAFGTTPAVGMIWTATGAAGVAYGQLLQGRN